MHFCFWHAIKTILSVSVKWSGYLYNYNYNILLSKEWTEFLLVYFDCLRCIELCY